MVTHPSSARLALRNLPAFSPVASKLMTMLRREHVNFKDAAELIKSDAGMSAELLRLANSPITGIRFPSTSVLHALSVLGVKRVASLTATLSIGKMLRPVSKLPLMRRCWRHNLATALIAREKSDEYDIDSEDGYMFGLLAGIGTLALLVSEPAAYCQLVRQAAEEDIALEVLEFQFFGFDNREAGAQLVLDWHLPQDLLKVFSPGNDSDLARLIHRAGFEAARLGFGVIGVHMVDTADPEAFEIAERVNWVEQELGI